MSKAERILKKFMISFLAVMAIIEIWLIIYNNEVALPVNIGMLLLCVPDTIISFIRKSEMKWWDLWMMVLYFALALISFVCNLIFA